MPTWSQSIELQTLNPNKTGIAEESVHGLAGQPNDLSGTSSQARSYAVCTRSQSCPPPARTPVGPLRFVSDSDNIVSVMIPSAAHAQRRADESPTVGTWDAALKRFESVKKAIRTIPRVTGPPLAFALAGVGLLAIWLTVRANSLSEDANSLSEEANKYSKAQLELSQWSADVIFQKQCQLELARTPPMAPQYDQALRKMQGHHGYRSSATSPSEL